MSKKELKHLISRRGTRGRYTAPRNPTQLGIQREHSVILITTNPSRYGKRLPKGKEQVLRVLTIWRVRPWNPWLLLRWKHTAYCIPCGKGYYPLDAVLDLAPRRKQRDLQTARVRLTTEVPSETASEVFAELTGLSVSAHTTHTVTNEVAEGLRVLEVSPPPEDIAARIAAVAHGKTQPPIVVLGIDGAQVPPRPETAKGTRPGRKKVRAKRARWQGEWREAKGFRFYVVDADRRPASFLLPVSKTMRTLW